MSALRIERVSKHWGPSKAVDDISFATASGRLVVLLGPSGCGKSTTLRMIAGLDVPTTGRVWIGERDVTAVAPAQRRISMVFQSYALFPHLDVRENILFGVKVRGEPATEHGRRLARVAELLGLTPLLERKPSQLSGGQQQRVALARALVLTPQVLLLDEPLGALDARLRKDLQVELKALQAELGITFVFVTHDQEEALTMSDRVAVMSGGRVEQAGTPREIYEEPATEFVADFLGVSNLLTAAASADGDGCALRVGERTLQATSGATEARGDVKAMIRPERVAVEPQGTMGDNRLPGLVERAVYVGSAYELHVRLVGGSLLKATIVNDGTPFAYEEGTPVTLYLPPDAVRVLTPSPLRAETAA